MDWEAGHLTVIVGTGAGAFANESCLQVRAFNQFFQMPQGLPGAGGGGYRGMLAAGSDSRIKVINPK